MGSNNSVTDDKMLMLSYYSLLPISLCRTLHPKLFLY